MSGIKATTEGDLGDAIVMSGILAQLPGNHSFLIRRSTVTKWRTDEAVDAAIALLKPLVETIPNIKEIRAAQPDEKADWDSAMFRPRHYRPTHTLFVSHANHLAEHLHLAKVPLFKPWLKVEPNSRFWNKFIVNRSARHRNDLFPWHRMVESYGYKMVFIGTQQEHEDFCNAFGRVAYHRTETLLDVAQAIAGCERFIGNQSSAHCIAAALGHPLLLEVSLANPDVCFGGSNVLYCYSGAIPYYSMPMAAEARPAMPKSVVPPGTWQFPGHGNSPFFNVMVSKLKRAGILNPEKTLMDENISRIYAKHPNYFSDSSFALVEMSLKNAGL
jgi:hypothetical protein